MPFKKIARKIHLWLGLTSGLVVFLVSITGCIYLKLLQKGDLPHQLLLFQWILQPIDAGVVEDQVDKRQRTVFPTSADVPPPLLVKGIVLIESRKL